MAILTNEKAICTPHLAWLSEESGWNIRKQIVADVDLFMHQQGPRHPIDKGVRSVLINRSANSNIVRRQMTMDGKMVGLFKTARGEGNINLLETDIPHPKADEVLIEIKAAGICGTDIHILHDQYPYWPPVILGHEFSGQIVEIGAEVTGYKVGDRVVGEPHTLACGKCEFAVLDTSNCAPPNAPSAGGSTGHLPAT